MESQQYIDKIASYIGDRFTIDTDDIKMTREFESLSNDKLLDKKVLRIKRNSIDLEYWKTFLIVVLDDIQHLEITLQWCACVKDELLDPENSDLYLIVMLQGVELSLDQCINFEADERFCRKYVLRPKETLYDLLNRSCVAAIDSKIGHEQFFDPLRTAFQKTFENHSWLNDALQEQWKRALLSGETGKDLIAMLFTESTSNQ